MSNLAKGPEILHVPDIAGRYYSIEFVDPWLKVFADVGRLPSQHHIAITSRPPKRERRPPSGFIERASTRSSPRQAVQSIPSVSE